MSQNMQAFHKFAYIEKPRVSREYFHDKIGKFRIL